MSNVNSRSIYNAIGNCEACKICQFVVEVRTRCDVVTKLFFTADGGNFKILYLTKLLELVF